MAWPVFTQCSGEDAEEAVAWEEAWHSDAWLRALALFLRKVRCASLSSVHCNLEQCADHACLPAFTAPLQHLLSVPPRLPPSLPA